MQEFKKRLYLLIAVLVVLFLGGLAAIHLLDSEDDIPPPELAFNSPYNAIAVHLYYLQADHYDPVKAAQALRYQGDREQAQKLALELKQILDGRGLIVDLRALPQQADFQDTVAGKLVPQYKPFPAELPDVFVSRRNGRWKYSAETIAEIPRLHRETYPYGTGQLLDIIPPFGQQRILGIAIWQLVGIALLVALVFFLRKLLTRIFQWLILSFTSTEIGDKLIFEKATLKVARLLAVVIVLWLFKLLLPVLQLEPTFTYYALLFVSVLQVVFLMLLALAVLELLLQYVGIFTARTETRMDNQFMPVLRKILQVVIVAVALLQILSTLNVNVTALIAGISIGGLAIALAAQDTVKNFIGSLVIFIDKPFEIGQYIITPDFDGTVEEVGVRSTRIRKPDSTLVYVPNGRLADMTTQNLGLRTLRRYRTLLGIQYNTPPEVIEVFIDNLRRLVSAQPFSVPEKTLVEMHEFAESSLQILIIGIFDIHTYDGEMRMRHRVMLDILRLAKIMNVGIAFPSRSLYIEQSPSSDGTTFYPLDQNTPDAQRKRAREADLFLSRMEEQSVPDRQEEDETL